MARRKLSPPSLSLSFSERPRLRTLPGAAKQRSRGLVLRTNCRSRAHLYAERRTVLGRQSGVLPDNALDRVTAEMAISVAHEQWPVGRVGLLVEQDAEYRRRVPAIAVRAGAGPRCRSGHRSWSWCALGGAGHRRPRLARRPCPAFRRRASGAADGCGPRLSARGLEAQPQTIESASDRTGVGSLS